MSQDKILASVNQLVSAPIAIESLWDFDGNGWFISMGAVTSGYQRIRLGRLSFGGDLRILCCQVPPWPEAVAAQRLGYALADRFSSEFYFPSPDYPEAECPTWLERSSGYPCGRCEIPLLQRGRCPWYGYCYKCHMTMQRERREMGWTPAQKAGPLCIVCGNPATGELNCMPVCKLHT